ncbi:hypothetical protein D0Z07_0904 [Hyphodiscus hymeniophilus]|uniref:Uncharacterized protein n=1 Tax=Hyphodiscus hymeniophilus TaxID=353542 RepID=A0A9P7B0B9_9HELO|nr:hypothetical protein D0Z07_0904 [Hyphodiscus hymeniophilus]
MTTFQFLSLAPVASASYPSTPVTKSPVQSSAKIATIPEENVELNARRSSSVASEANGKLRFLKLGPVHYGVGDGLGDWSDVAIAE